MTESKIVFASNEDGDLNIFIANLDGSNLKKLYETLLFRIAELKRKVIELKRDKIGVHPDSTWELPCSLIYRIVSVSKLFEPNVFTTGDSARLISPERGLLLKALVDNKIDLPLVPNPNFANADLSWANLTNAKLNDAHIANANLNGAFLTGAGLRWANLSNANLTNAHLGKANFSGAYLMETNLISVIGLSVDQLCRTNISLNARLDS